MTTRAEVEQAVAEQDSRLHLILSNADGRCLAERLGDGHSGAAMIVLGLPASIEAGMHFASRPEQPDAIRKALKRQGKKRRAANRAAAKRKAKKSVPPAPPTRPSRGLSRRPASPEPPAPPEPPPEPQIPGPTSTRIEVV